jgi:hypothetical protein
MGKSFFMYSSFYSYRAPLNENLMLLQQYQQYTLQQSNSQQQGQQAATHSAAPLSYFLGHPPSGPSYSPGIFDSHYSITYLDKTIFYPRLLLYRVNIN